MIRLIGPQELRIAYWHLRCLYVELNDRLPTLEEVRHMFIFMRPEISPEESELILSYATDQLQKLGILPREGQQDQPLCAWLPIETAPKDGTIILLGSPKFLYTYRGWWKDDAEYGVNIVKPGWQIFECEDDSYYSVAIEPSEPTCWQPLPPLPETST